MVSTGNWAHGTEKTNKKPWCRSHEEDMRCVPLI